MFVKNFNHVELKRKDLNIERIDGGEFRLYKTNDGIFPSVTSVLSVLENTELEKWKNAVGEEVASRISKEATDHGTLIHSLCENYLNNEPLPKNPLSLDLFLPIKKILDKNVDDIIGIELFLYSKKLRCAGTTDLCASFDGKKSLIDFKTSRRHKSKDDISGYFLQASAYAMMIYEQYGIILEDLVIIMLVEGGDTLIFKEKTKDWYEKFYYVRKEFEKRYGI